MSDEQQWSAVEVFQRFLEASVNNDWDAVADSYAEDVVVEIPFAPPGVPVATRGREVLRARFHGAAGIRRFTGSSDVVITRSDDPEVIFAEYQLLGAAVATGKAFASRYVMRLTVRDGLIVHSRDYGNPIATAVALDRVPELLAALTNNQGSQGDQG
ncbi:nuclear transport factor 2 family protein [Kitasatospora sp. NPDC001683]